MVLRIVLPLLATIVIELGVLLLLGEGRRSVLWASVPINVLTNVPLNLFAIHVSDSLETVFVGEALVTAVEAFCYLPLVGVLRKAAVYSLLCNAVSFLTGELMFLIFLCFTK